MAGQRGSAQRLRRQGRKGTVWGRCPGRGRRGWQGWRPASPSPTPAAPPPPGARSSGGPAVPLAVGRGAHRAHPGRPGLPHSPGCVRALVRAGHLQQGRAARMHSPAAGLPVMPTLSDLRRRPAVLQRRHGPALAAAAAGDRWGGGNRAAQQQVELGAGHDGGWAVPGGGRSKRGWLAGWTVSRLGRWAPCASTIRGSLAHRCIAAFPPACQPSTHAPTAASPQQLPALLFPADAWTRGLDGQQQVWRLYGDGMVWAWV